MHRKSYSVVLIIGSVVLTAIAFFTLGSVYQMRVTPVVVETEYVSPEGDSALVKFMEAYYTIESRYYKDVDSNDLAIGAINGMIEVLDDPYSSYFDAEQAKKFNDSLSSEYEGIGATLNGSDGYITIISPFKDSPAEEAGLKPRDRIIGVDGENIVGQSIDEVISKIKGPADTDVTLTIERPGVSEPFDIMVTRGVIPLVSVTSELIQENDKKIGYIELSQFGEKTAEEFKTQLTELEDKDIDSLIIDVRGNPGGYLVAVVEILEEFIPKDNVMIKFEERDGSISSYKSEVDSEFKQYDVGVLIDGGSASASEILAAGLSESLGYKLFGETSFGKGTVQTQTVLEDGSTLKYTIEKWLTPEGTWVHGEGINPDYDIDYPEYYLATPINLDGEQKQDDVSDVVKNAQEILNYLGFTVREDGYFDENTKASLTIFQTQNELEVTGTLNEETASLLESMIINMVNDGEDDTILKFAIEYFKELEDGNQ